MASIAFPDLSKHHTLSTSHTYNYIFQRPATTTHSTILFIHGFPSSSYDWRHQITHFANKGHGILAPDLLGYGGTSKPSTLNAYKARAMATELIELLDHEGIDKVHAVGHDAGCPLLSRLANYFPHRLLSCSFLGMPYTRPAEHFDLDAVNALTKQVLGVERFGYLGFFLKDGAGDVLDRYADSFFSLFYPATPSLWTTHLGPTGAFEAWLLADQRAPLPSYITEEERKTHQAILQNNHTPALTWYHALANNINEDEEKDLDPTLHMPILMIRSQPGEMELPGAEEQMRSVAGDVSVRRVGARGHWVQLEAREEVNQALGEVFDVVEGSK